MIRSAGWVLLGILILLSTAHGGWAQIYRPYENPWSPPNSTDRLLYPQYYSPDRIIYPQYNKPGKPATPGPEGQLYNQSDIGQPSSQPASQPSSQPLSQPASQPLSQPASQPASQQGKQPCKSVFIGWIDSPLIGFYENPPYIPNGSHLIGGLEPRREGNRHFQIHDRLPHTIPPFSPG